MSGWHDASPLERADIVRKASTVFFPIAALAAGYFAVHAGLCIKERASLASDYQKAVADLRNTREAIQAAGKLTETDLAENYSASSIQGLLEKGARRSNCQLTDFSAAADMMPFTSRFGTDRGPAGWSQTSMHASLHGETKGLWELLRSLSLRPLPIEVETVDWTRTGTDKSGHAQSAMQLDFRFIAKDRTR